MKHVIELDNLPSDSILLTSYGGQRVAVTRERLQELLAREQEYFEVLARERSVPPVVTRPEPPAAAGARPDHEFSAGALPRESVSHASLSTRIKKVYMYSLQARKLRDAHMTQLLDMIADFDWQIPRHPNTRLQQHLVEMLGWKGVTPVFREAVMAFLDRYLVARQRPG